MYIGHHMCISVQTTFVGRVEGNELEIWVTTIFRTNVGIVLLLLPTHAIRILDIKRDVHEITFDHT